ncbi:ribonuclease HII [Labilibacter marinus]|uniref:ribonuclease HII n=1 Tax=Labilibacter marinus TaxID=1477105 RepID=UPI00094FAEFC|nr:ribonuclease HII [Labilibacter marinus]
MKSKLELYLHKDKIEAGCDEAGRGCLAGPVVAAAVILPDNFEHPLLNDSKQLTEKQRETLRPIIEKEALAWSVAFVDNNEVDEINVLNASITGMQRSVKELSITPEHLLIDGNRFKPYKNIPHTCIIKGDGKYMPIAAASILAKTHRDELMEKLDQEYPGYAWKKNKGYPTKAHRAAIEKLGTTPYHRQSFKLLDTQLKLNI